jgi:anti-anti-sigma factor
MRGRKEAHGMTITVESRDGVSILVPPATALTASHVGEFKVACESLLVPNCKVLVDLTAVGFLDSSGCSALLHLHRKAREHGGGLRICCVSSSVRALFDQLRITRVIPIHATRDEALKLISEG